MSLLVWESQPPELRSPILVTAFQGWFDLGKAATGALEWLSRRSESTRVAYIDSEELFDFTQQPPSVCMVDGRSEIIWPTTDVHVLRYPETDRDLVLVTGTEPQLHWRCFVDAVSEIIASSGALLLVTLGAMVDDVPHTRPLKVTGSTSNPDLAAALGLRQPTYQGVTGVIGVLHDRFQHSDTPAVSLRVGVPHYVSGSPNPKGSRALLERLERITGLATNWSGLDPDVREWESLVDQAMQQDNDVVSYVRLLEARADARTAEDMPSAEAIGAEFERYLRRHGAKEQP